RRRRRRRAVLRVQSTDHGLPALRRPAAGGGAQSAPVPSGRERQPAPALPDRAGAHPAARPWCGRAEAAPRARWVPDPRPRALPGLRGAGRTVGAAGGALWNVVVPGGDERGRRPDLLLSGAAAVSRAPRRARPRWPGVVVRRRRVPGAVEPAFVDRVVAAASHAAAAVLRGVRPGSAGPQDRR